MVPQYSPVQPTGRSQPATRNSTGRASGIRPVARRAVGMAPKISRDAYRRQMRKQSWGGRWRRVEEGGGDIVAPCPHDCSGNFVPRNASSQFRGKRGYRTCDLWLAAYGCNDLLRAIEQDRPMLQECASLPDLCRADQLATSDEYLAADRSREARRGLVDPPGEWRSVGRQSRIDPEGPERHHERGVNRMVGDTQAAEQRDRGGHRVGHLVRVPHGPAAGGAPHDVEP